MATAKELEDKFWASLKSDMTVMLGLASGERGHVRPMTAQLEDGRKGDIWFFSSTDSDLVKFIKGKSRGALTFVSKGHDLYASVEGTLAIDRDPAMIDKLWNNHIAAWYKGGKEDPKLALLKFTPDHGEIWIDGSSIVAGIKMMLGADPKTDYKDNVKEVNFRPSKSS